MDFEELKKELQKILAHYSKTIEMVNRNTNTFLGEFNEELECDGYFKIVELIEKCHNECHLFINNNIPEDYWQKDDEESVEEEYCYHPKKHNCDNFQSTEINQSEYIEDDIYGYHFEHYERDNYSECDNEKSDKNNEER